MPLEDSDAEEFEVERIVFSRIVRGRTEYLVHWKGYGSWEDSWEPISWEENSKEAIDLYHRARGSRAR